MQDKDGLKEIANKTNIDILALDRAIFYISLCHKVLEKISDESLNESTYDFTHDTVIDSLYDALLFLKTMFSNSYDESNVTKFITESSSVYTFTEKIPSEILSSRLISIGGMKDFENKEHIDIDMQNMILVGMYGMATFAHTVPAYFESVNMIYEKFLDFTIYTPD